MRGVLASQNIIAITRIPLLLAKSHLFTKPLIINLIQYRMSATRSIIIAHNANPSDCSNSSWYATL
jgi:hypothetical protein